MCEQVDAIAHKLEYMLDHPMVRPLTDIVRHELNVMKAARWGLQITKFVRYECIVVRLLELRAAINAWDAADEGEVSMTVLRAPAARVSIRHHSATRRYRR